MKWVRGLGFLLFGVFLCVAALTIFLETAAGARFAKDFFLQSLSQSGIHVEIESLGGQLPEEMDLKGVKITGIDNQIISIETLHLELSLLRLLKKEIAIKRLVASGIRLEPALNTKQSSPSSVLPLPCRLKVLSFQLDRIEQLPNVTLSGKLNVKKRVKLELNAQTNQYGPLNLNLSIAGTFSSWAGSFQGDFSPDISSLQKPYQEWMESPWHFEGNIEKTAAGMYKLQKIGAIGRFLNLKGAADFDQKGQLIEGRFQALNPKSQFFATTELQASVEGINLHSQWRLPSFPIEGQIDGKVKDKTFFGKTAASGTWMKERFAAKSNLTYRLGESFQFEQIVLNSPLGDANGDLVLRSDHFWVGKIFFSSLNLSALRLPELTGFSNGQATFEVAQENSQPVQVAHLNALSKEVVWEKTYAKEVVFYADLKDNGTSHFHVGLKDAQWKELLIGNGEIDFGESGPFQFTADGTLRDPFYLIANGSFQQGELKLDHLKGSFLTRPVELTAPTSFAWSASSWNLDPTALSLGTGTLLARGSSKEGVSLNMTQLPLDLLSLNS
ncbi:MAG TPA: hypothetical protein VGM34_04455, partial [Chlamydiales bacterium]